jgi:type IV pilus assembly protein PilM
MRILGIDIGSSSIKALEMDSAFGRYDIHDYHEVELKATDDPEVALSKLVGTLTKTPDRIVVALPAGKVTLRNLQLPTRDKKSILSGVGFELEDELPFPMEEATYDYTVLNQGRQGSAVHVAATLKRHAASTLARYENSKLAPDMMTTEPWAYRTLLNRVLGPNAPDAPVLLIDIGQNRTLFYVQKKETPTFVREIQWGGADLTAAIGKKFSFQNEQAESAKLDRGIVSGAPGEKELSPEELEIAQCLEEALETGFSHELRQIELMCKNVTTQNISQIYLTGGTSLLTGLAPWIESKIKIPTKLLPALSSITPSGVTYSDQTDARFLLAASLALCMVGTHRTSINFRKGEFAKHGKSRELNFKVLRKPLIAAAIVLTTLLLSLTIQSAVYQSKMTTTNALLERSVKTFFGSPSANTLRTYMSNTTTLRTAINKELTKQRELSKLFGPNPHSPLEFLNVLSNSIPKNVVIDLTLYQAGVPPIDSYVNGTSPHSAQLTFLASNPQNMEKLNTLLGERLSGMVRGKTEETTIEGEPQKKWKQTFTGKPIEESYGK